MWKDTTFRGIPYVYIRNLMLDGGILDMFRPGYVMGSVKTANPILSWLLLRGKITRSKKHP